MWLGMIAARAQREHAFKYNKAPDNGTHHERIDENTGSFENIYHTFTKLLGLIRDGYLTHISNPCSNASSP